MSSIGQPVIQSVCQENLVPAITQTVFKLGLWNLVCGLGTMRRLCMSNYSLILTTFVVTMVTENLLPGNQVGDFCTACNSLLLVFQNFTFLIKCKHFGLHYCEFKYTCNSMRCTTSTYLEVCLFSLIQDNTYIYI